MTSKVLGSSPGGSGGFSLFRQFTSPTDPLNYYLYYYYYYPPPTSCLFVLFVCFLLFQFVASTVQSTNIKRDEQKEKIKQSREEDATERKGKLRETEKECGLGGFMNHY